MLIVGYSANPSLHGISCGGKRPRRKVLCAHGGGGAAFKIDVRIAKRMALRADSCSDTEDATPARLLVRNGESGCRRSGNVSSSASRRGERGATLRLPPRGPRAIA